MLNIELFQGHTEKYVPSDILSEGGAQVHLVSELQVEEDTSTSGVYVMERSVSMV